MTKYVLNSGRVTRYPDRAKKFFTEVFRDTPTECRFLVCLFAMVREDWSAKFQSIQESYSLLFPQDKKVIMEMADPLIFEDQVKRSNIVYMCGGDDHLLLYWLRQFDIPKIWDGKIVAGSSAGFDVLTKHFAAIDWRYFMDGLGIIPVKVIPHYGSDYGNDDLRGPIDWEKFRGELAEYGDTSLPIIALDEGEFVVYNI